MVSSSTDTAEGLKESWELIKQIKNPYSFNEKQKSFLVSKFNIGQDGKWKMDPEVVAKEMRRVERCKWKRLFATSEFLTPGQNSFFFFSRLAAKIRQQPVAHQSKKTTWKLQQKRTTLPLLENLFWPHSRWSTQLSVISKMRASWLRQIPGGVLP